MASSIEEFTNEIWELDNIQIDLNQWLEQRLKQHSPQLNDLQINDILEDIVNRVKSRLKKKIRLYKEKGLQPIYDFHPLLPDTLVHSEDISSAKLQEMKLKIKTMSWVEFEHLCMEILKANGIERVGVTRKIKEGGIDFYGLLQMDKYTSGALLKDLEIRIIGQARHHSGFQKVGPDELKVLNQDCQNFENGQSTVMKVLPDWFINLASPVVPMFITNTSFTKGADSFAKQKGIITKNGDQITYDLMLPPKYLNNLKSI